MPNENAYFELGIAEVCIAEPHHVLFGDGPIISENKGRGGEIRKYMDKRFAKLENFGPRHFYFQICEFCACKSNALTDRRLVYICGRVCNFFMPFSPKKFCRKGLTGLWQGRRRHATACLLECNGGLIATSGGPYGKTAAFFRSKNGGEIAK